MVTFSHLEAGTDEQTWIHAFATRNVPLARLDADGIVIVAAHPDDESLGVAGLAHAAARDGIPLHVIIATNGERSHPDSPTHSPRRLARLRRREVESAIGIVSDDATMRFLDIPDGGIGEAEDLVAGAVRTAVGAVADDPARVLVIAPWTGDGHRDHRLVGAVAERVAAEQGAMYRGYPIWLWHWGSEDDAPWERMEAVTLDASAQDAKRRAIEAHESQIAALSDAAGDEAILHDAMREHFARPFEILIRPEPRAHAHAPEAASVDSAFGPPSGSVPAAHFDDFFATHDDPWGFESRWYERRKRDLLLASLPRQRYTAGLELGCATGVLTTRLAVRCERLVAVDFSREALDAARERLGDRDNVELQSLVLPHEWPRGAFDLIVLSEIGYFWDARDLDTAIARIQESLTPDGHLVACHWRHPVPSNPVTGDGVHVALRTQPRLQTMVLHEEEDFLLEVFATSPASVARETGMLG